MPSLVLGQNWYKKHYPQHHGNITFLPQRLVSRLVNRRIEENRWQGYNQDIEKWQVYFSQKRNGQPRQSHNLKQASLRKNANREIKSR